MKAIMFPGQGSQYRGMGKSLFSKYRVETDLASEILGYDLEELCVNDPNKVLAKTNYTQPALFAVNAFTFNDTFKSDAPDYLIGHSLGEYNALHAAGAFDFETGIKLVQKRGALMAAASGGGMAAILGLDAEGVQRKLDEGGHDRIDIANYNTPTQIVVAGPEDAITNLCKDMDSQGIKAITLFVTAPFHSRYMKPASDEFSLFLNDFEFEPLNTPVISNTTAKPYQDDQISRLLSAQISSPVKWIETVQFLMGKKVEQYEEVGSAILTKMVKDIQSACEPIVEVEVLEPVEAKTPEPIVEHNFSDGSQALGSKSFRDAYGVKLSYVAGSMYRGIASKEHVVLLAKANILSFLGAGGLRLNEIESNIDFIQNELTKDHVFGVNLLHNIDDEELEMNTVSLFLYKGIKIVEASAFMQVSLSLVYYRLKGLRRGPQNEVICDNKIIAKISRPEVAEAFMKPAPQRLVNRLLDSKLISEEEALMAKEVPMSFDICVEADSGGHTDRGVGMVLLPAIQSLKKEVEAETAYNDTIRIGLAGGIGTPQAAACAFVMGADFILTGSINQCTVDAGTSDAVKDLLQEINVQDTGYAPAGDMFEIGAKVQVLKKGSLFSARANKLFSLYQQYDSIESIPENVRLKMEKTYFKKNMDQIWIDTKDYLEKKGAQTEINAAEQNKKKKMSLIFRWYFGYSSRLSFEGDINNKINFQVHTGPALGAFNQWVKGTPLENWRDRKADVIGIKIMTDAAELINNI